MKICKSCGTQNPEASKLCMTCSLPLTEEPAPESAAVEAEASAVESVEIPRPRRVWPPFLWLIPIPLVYVFAVACRWMYYDTTASLWKLLYNVCRILLPVTIVVCAALLVFGLLRAMVSRIKYRRACRRNGIVPVMRASKKEKKARKERHFKRLGRDLVEESGEEPVPEEGEALTPASVSNYSTLLEVDSRLSRQEPKEYTPTPTPKDLNRAFREFAGERGVRISKKQTSALFASMGASRVVWILDRRPELTQKLLEILAAFLGTELHLQSVGEGWSAPGDLLVQSQLLQQKESGFFADIYAASYLEKDICLAALDGVDPSTAEAYFGEFFDYAHHPLRDRSIRVPRQLHGELPRHLSGNYYELPGNLWFFLRLSSATEVAVLPESSMLLDLSDLGEVEHWKPNGDEIAPVVLSLASFEEMLEQAKVQRYLSEEEWKTLDALEDYIAQRLPAYRLSNRVARQIEAYTALYLSAEGKAQEVLDLAVAYKMLPALVECPVEVLSDPINGLSLFLDQTFGLDHMPHCLRVLKQMHLV